MRGERTRCGGRAGLKRRVGRTHGGAAARAPPAGGKGVPRIVAAARPAVAALFARSLRAVPRHASVFVRARRGERSLLHDRRPAILAAAAGHHHSEDRLQRGGYHSRRLVHAARQASLRLSLGRQFGC